MKQLDSSLAYKYFMSYRMFDGQKNDESIVPYHAARAYKHLLQKVLRKSNLIQATLSLIIFLICLSLCYFVQQNLNFAFIILSITIVLFSPIIPMLITIYSWTSPSHISISPAGIKLYWRHWYGDKTSKIIPWQEIALVLIKKEHHNFLTLEDDWIEFLDSKENSQSLLKLRLQGIRIGDHRKRFLSALKQHLPLKQIDKSIQDALNPVRLDSHTKLWLEVLASSSKRNTDCHLKPGQTLANNRYRIKEELAIGGQAITYIAEESNPESSDSEFLPTRTVVLKEFVLPAEASFNVSKRAFESIEKEAKLLAKVTHPNIVKFLDLFVDDKRAYMVLEHIPGRNLRKFVSEDGTLGEIDLWPILNQMLSVLSYLHELSPAVIHRDFTPDNLILTPEGELKLIDFNVAQVYESTATRTVVGKHSYLPPEQFRGKACPASDIYALGASVYFLLTGIDPEPISQSEPRKILPMLSSTINKLVLGCTEPELQDRYKSISQIMEELNNQNSNTSNINKTTN